jgi:hypothetical protein
VTTTPRSASPAYEKRQYLRELQRELSVLPRNRGRDVLRDVTDHLDEMVDDDRSPRTIVGAPDVIARAALRDHDQHTGKRLRPSWSMRSKQIQLFVAILYCVPAAYGLTMLFFDGEAWPLWEQLLPLLLLAPTPLLFVPPLTVGWTRWWAVSVVCAGAYAVYVLAAVLVSVLAGTNLLATHLFLAPLSIVALLLLPALILLATALVIAPAVLRGSAHRS